MNRKTDLDIDQMHREQKHQDQTDQNVGQGVASNETAPLDIGLIEHSGGKGTVIGREGEIRIKGKKKIAKTEERKEIEEQSRKEAKETEL